MFIFSAPFWGQVLWPRVTVLFLCSPEACGVGVSWTMDSPFLLLCASLLPGHSTGLRCSCPLKNFVSKVLVTFSSCYQPLSLALCSDVLLDSTICMKVGFKTNLRRSRTQDRNKYVWSSKSVVLNLFEVEWHLRKLAMFCTLLRSALSSWGAVTLLFC